MKKLGPVFGSAHNEDHSISGVVLGPPIDGSPQLGQLVNHQDHFEVLHEVSFQSSYTSNHISGGSRKFVLAHDQAALVSSTVNLLVIRVWTIANMKLDEDTQWHH